MHWLPHRSMIWAQVQFPHVWRRPYSQTDDWLVKTSRAEALRGAPLVAHLTTLREGDKAIVIQTTHVYRRHSSWLSPCTRPVG